MKKVRIVLAVFDAELKPFEIPAFRGAVVEKVGRDNLLFHNHLDSKEFLYKYPLIQYKSIQGKPGIMCIEEGSDEIHKFFEKKDWAIKIGERTIDMPIYRLSINQYNIQVWESQFTYLLRSWIGLNQDNYDRYNKLDSLSARIEMLEKLIIGNIISLAKGIKWDVDKVISVKILNLEKTKLVSYKKQRLLAFDMIIKTNVFLPNQIGLGKGVSHGFGTVKQLKTTYNEREKEQ